MGRVGLAAGPPHSLFRACPDDLESGLTSGLATVHKPDSLSLKSLSDQIEQALANRHVLGDLLEELRELCPLNALPLEVKAVSLENRFHAETVPVPVVERWRSWLVAEEQRHGCSLRELVQTTRDDLVLWVDVEGDLVPQLHVDGIPLPTLLEFKQPPPFVCVPLEHTGLDEFRFEGPYSLSVFPQCAAREPTHRVEVSSDGY